MITQARLKFTSILLLLISLIALGYVDFQIVAKFNASDGKTQGLFGLIVLGDFPYRDLILLPAALSIMIAVRCLYLAGFNTQDLIVILMGISVIAGVFLPLWQLLI